MKVQIEDIENAAEGRLEVDFCEVMPEIENAPEAKGKLEIISNGASIEVKGEVSTVLTLVCDRCLNEFKYDLKAVIEEVFVKGNVFDYTKHEIELKNDNFVVELNGETEIDITDLVYQSIIVNMPTKKICRHDCEGEMQIPLEENRVDPRLEVFKRLSDEMKER